MSGGVFACGVAFGGITGAAQARRVQTVQKTISAWVTLQDSGEIIIVCPGIELGQGVSTTLPRFLAEELDADWKDVRVVPAPSEEKTYGNPFFFGFQITAGSRTCVGYFETLRIAGAQARYVIMQAAAARMRCPLDELTTQDSVVYNKERGRQIRYSELVRSVRVPDNLPTFAALDDETPPDDVMFGKAPASALAANGSSIKGQVLLKSRHKYRLIGVDAPRQDIPAKVSGKAAYGIDFSLPNMVCAMVETGPIPGSTPAQVEDTDARSSPGIVDIIKLPRGVAVVGIDFIAVRAARAKLRVQWNPPADIYNTETVMHQYSELASDPGKAALRVFEKGKPGHADALLAGAPGLETIFLEHRSEFIYHSPIEPQNATLRIADDGKSAEAWHGTQWPSQDQKDVGEILGLPPNSIKINTLYPGGSFGRRQEAGAILDAARLARTLRRPVKVLWTREDDLKRNPYRQAMVCRVEAAVRPDGTIAATRHRVVADSWIARKFPDMWQAFNKADPGNWTGSLYDYEVPFQAVDAILQRRSIDVCYMRGIGVSQTKFAQETLIDLAAAHGGRDPLDFRMELIPKSPRGLAVLKRVAEMSGWREKRRGGLGVDRALGLAYTPYSGSHGALVADVSVDRKTGEIRVREVWSACDVGFAAQPDIVVSQIEGAILQALSIALLEQVTFKNGVAEQTNFDGYNLLRMSQVPVVNIELLPTDNGIGGAGELGMIQIGAAVNNAIAQIIGVPLSRTPMLPSDVLHALATGRAPAAGPAAPGAPGNPRRGCSPGSTSGPQTSACPGSPWDDAPKAQRSHEGR